MITIIDYGMGNHFSVKKAFQRLGFTVKISHSLEDIKKAEKFIFPGVGNFSRGIENLNQLDIVDIIKHRILIEKIPVLGICLGMQLLTNFSEEGNQKGLGFIDLKVKKFNNNKLKVPHMGWNNVKCHKKFNLFHGIAEETPFYFVHSYYINLQSPSPITIGITDYGQSFISAFNKENIYGVQFHPEKSHDQGLALLNNFAQI